MRTLEMIIAIVLLFVTAREICIGNIVLSFVFLGLAVYAMIHGGAADPEEKQE